MVWVELVITSRVWLHLIHIRKNMHHTPVFYWMGVEWVELEALTSPEWYSTCNAMYMYNAVVPLFFKSLVKHTCCPGCNQRELQDIIVMISYNLSAMTTLVIS